MDKLTKVLTYDITDDMNMSTSTTETSELDQYHKRKLRFRLPLNQKITFLWWMSSDGYIGFCQFY